MSDAAQVLSECTLPVSLRGTVWGLYSQIYKVDTSDMTLRFDQYSNFREFFTRNVKQRQIDQNPSNILSPADSRLLAKGQVTSNQCFVVKGYNYCLGQLISGKKELEITDKQLNLIKKKPQNKLYYAVLYLSPGDYHHFHSMVDFQVVRRIPIQGALSSVSKKALTKRQKTYQTNSRFVFHGKWKQGYLGMVFVGALNVGKIIIKQKSFFKKGDEIGHFSLGSTIVVFIESPQLSWSIKEDEKIRYAQPIASSVKSTQKQATK